MTNPRRRQWLAVPVLVVVTLASAACQAADTGDAASASPSAQASEAPASSPSAAASEAPAADALVIVSESDLGPILTDADGNTLYLFANDSPGETACVDDCATNWPPLTVTSEDEAVAAPEVEGELGTIERPDGTLQVTINDLPLHYFAADTAPGDTNGHEVGGVWFAVTPSGDQVGGTRRIDYEY